MPPDVIIYSIMYNGLVMSDLGPRLGLDPVELLAECWNLVRELVAGYIWQYQPFALRLQTNKGGN